MFPCVFAKSVFFKIKKVAGDSILAFSNLCQSHIYVTCPYSSLTCPLRTFSLLSSSDRQIMMLSFLVFSRKPGASYADTKGCLRASLSGANFYYRCVSTLWHHPWGYFKGETSGFVSSQFRQPCICLILHCRITYGNRICTMSNFS